MIKKKLLICLLFLVVISGLEAKIVQDFESFNVGETSGVMIKSISIVNYFYSEKGYSLSILRDIPAEKPCPAASAWSVANEFFLNFSPAENWKGFRYLSFMVRDLGNSMGGLGGASTIQVGLNDGDETWLHDVANSDGNWNKYIISLMDTGLNSIYTDKCTLTEQKNPDSAGFALPLWQLSDPFYVGNGYLDLGSIQSLKLSFGSIATIYGECIIDNIKVFNEFKSSQPSFFEGYITYLPAIPDSFIFNMSEALTPSSVGAGSVSLMTNANSGVVSINITNNSVSNILNIKTIEPLGYNVLYSLQLLTNFSFINGVRFSGNVMNQFMIKSNILLGKNKGYVFFQELGLGIAVDTNSSQMNYHFFAQKIEEPVSVIDKTIVSPIVQYAVFPEMEFEKKLKYRLDISGLNLDAETVKELKVFLKKGNDLVDMNATIDTETGIMGFESYFSGTFILGSVSSEVLLAESMIVVDKVENNIFKPETTAVKIFYTAASTVTKMQYRIFDSSGILVVEQIIADPTIGFIEWNGKDRTGLTRRPGVYIVEIKASGASKETEEFINWNENKGASQTVKIPVVLYGQ